MFDHCRFSFIIIYHDFLPPPMRDSHVKSDNTHIGAASLGIPSRLGIPFYTQSGRIGKVVASHAAVAHSSPAEVALIYTMHVVIRGYYP